VPIEEPHPQRAAVLLSVQKLLREVRYGRITISVAVHDGRLDKLSKTVEVVEDLTNHGK
jgi:hypothetical protein